MSYKNTSGRPGAMAGLALATAAGVAWYMTNQVGNKEKTKEKTEVMTNSELAGKTEWKSKVAGSFPYAEGASSPREAFEKAREKTGNTAPNVKARPASSEEVPETVENVRKIGKAAV
ncbi:hypothetical protein PsYK624_109800 [Phanerochaete sordida]|uniref:Uncharacterized protein n=1 Tax=Phanerochaete sordida TaxID=48140 RepID=A0A9P3GH27_9APHY|nr:hypothetical protein PsYK624_109800 [Phanerochaete sordida]